MKYYIIHTEEGNKFIQQRIQENSMGTYDEDEIVKVHETEMLKKEK